MKSAAPSAPPAPPAPNRNTLGRNSGDAPSNRTRMQERAHSARDFVGGGLAAGCAGAIVIGSYLNLTLAFAFHTATPATFFRYIASALGKSVVAAPGAELLGAALHLAIGAAWGAGYAYVAVRTPQVAARPLVSGTVFGIVVMFWMQFVEIAANIYALPSALELLNDFIAHTVFFGIPVAYIARRTVRPLRA